MEQECIQELKENTRTDCDFKKLVQQWNKAIVDSMRKKDYSVKFFSGVCQYLSLYAELYGLDGSKFTNAASAYSFAHHKKMRVDAGISLEICDRILVEATEEAERVLKRIQLNGFKLIDEPRITSPSPSIKPEYRELMEWVTENLTGKQRRVMEMVIEGDGSCPLEELAADRLVIWAEPYDDSWNSICRVLNTKLKRAGWRLYRQDNKACLSKLG